ncbi:DUF4097 family beta strand repeat-containing protein [Alkalicoccus halolimnae]|uniref:DUF4097 family beta strand repeat-containing protein n=1 Tax=Alkalicoccus halolimnae TaxID=1667239 RepID=A0A5C7F1B0_9BACI|nr:DUF4097 family beta strand repeat-containing protein [Alkalicoccus halolimnae]TXF83325.1 DUF4097 domain-containing protein [Alkalicoccus halolimnae]
MNISVRILLIVISFLLIGAAGVLYAIDNYEPAQQEVLEERTLNEEIGEMEITVENSRVEFLPSTDDTSRIVLAGSSDDFTLRTEVSETRLEIEVEDRSQFFIFDFNRSSLLQVYVPEDGLDSLSAVSDNGAIQVEGILTEELTLEADNGRIELESVESESVDAETNNGRIELTDIEADMSVRTSNGRIIFTDVSGELQVRADNGRIDLTVGTLNFPVDLETNNGRIEIQTESEPANARIEARVDNGRIDVYGRNNEETIFGDGDVQIQLVSSNGRIVVE